MPKPITKADVNDFRVLPFRQVDAVMVLKCGWVFEYSFGYVRRIENLHGYSSLQDPNKIPLYYGEVKMTRDEAVQLARDSLKKLGIRFKDVYAEFEPVVTPPVKVGTNIVPHYKVEWLEPYGGDSPSVVIHINANTKQIERIYMRSDNLKRPAPDISVAPVSDPDWPSVNPEYARQLIPMMSKAIGEFAKKLSLPIPYPLTTNNVARVEIHDNEGWPHAEITTTNGWLFVYRHTMVNGYYAPDNLFHNNRPNHIRHVEDAIGHWNLTTNQAIEIVRNTLARLNYPTSNIHMDFAPEIDYATGDFKKIIPRYFFTWNYGNATHDDLQSKVEAEVNADNGKLESIYYDDKAYWGSRPSIDVPISIRK